MSLFQWFSKKPADPDTAEPHSGLAHDSTQTHSASARSKGATANPSPRKVERMERREQLYGVVRECMTAAGVLSAAYKFKVLSLDSAGRQYLVMVDLALEYVADPARLTEIEAMIARGAKGRYDIQVTAVYWRMNEPAGASVSAPAPLTAPPAPRPAAPAAPTPAPAARGPLAEDMAAFKRGAGTAPAAAEKPRTPRLDPRDMPSFQDTEIVEDPPSPLGRTQYGDLK